MELASHHFAGGFLTCLCRAAIGSEFRMFRHRPVMSFCLWMRLMSASVDKPLIGGVCYTLSKKLSLGIPTWVWRVLFVVSVVFYGFGVLPYIILWIFMPKAH